LRVGNLEAAQENVRLLTEELLETLAALKKGVRRG
jgi:hypothetical protein